MQYSVRLPFQLTQHLGEIRVMDKESSVQPHAALVAAALSISSLIYFLATSAKVPIRATLTTPSWEIIVEINPDRSPSHFNFLQAVAGMPIACDGEEITINDCSKSQ